MLKGGIICEMVKNYRSVNEMKIKKLHINSKPRIRTYTYHSFFHAIISADDKVSNIAAKIHIKNFDNYTWSEQKEELSYTRCGDTIIFKANKWNTGMNHCFWRKCLENDEIELKIEKQLFSNSWGAINIFITDNNQINMLEDDEYTYRLGNFCKDKIYLRINNSQIEMKNIEFEEPFSLIIQKKRNEYIAKIRKDNYEVKLNTWVSDDINKNMRIGFEIKLNNNAFYEWYFSNYIEIHGNITSSSPIPIDFLFNYRKNWCTYHTNYFVEYHTFNRNSISEYGMTVLEFVKASINLNQYVEMWLNENYLDDIKGEGIKPHIHQNLIYGYDDNDEILYVMQMKSGIPRLVKMKYKDFMKEDNFSEKHKLIVPTSYDPDYMVYELDPKYIAYILQVYIESIDMSMGMHHCIMDGQRTWGIELLKELNTESGLKCILSDIRVSHLLYERSHCMKERLEYMFARNIITLEELNSILPYVDKTIDITSIIRNLVLIKRYRKESTNLNKYIEKIKCHLCMLYDYEKKYVQIFINVLNSKK